MPDISVVVPVYKVESYLHRCVDSILNQSYQDFELILVDDGSPDRSGQICEEYASRDQRVHVIHQKNMGLSGARNTGIDWILANSSSRWITFVDSDDWIHPRMLECLEKAAEQQQTKISICGYEETSGKNPQIRQEDLESTAWLPRKFYQEFFVNATIACAKLYHISCFAECRFPLGMTHEDEFLTYRLLFSCEKVAVVPAPLYAYFVNSQGITRCAWSPKRLHAWEAYEQQIDFFQERGDEEMVRFRYQNYLENAVTNLRAAENAPNAAELGPEIKKIKRHIRKLIPRAWKHGCIHFWIDYDLLYEFYPIQTRIYRFWIDKVRRGNHA